MAAPTVGREDLLHRRVEALGVMDGEESVAHRGDVPQRDSAQIDGCPFQQPLKVDASHLVADGGLNDTEHLTELRLAAAHPLACVGGRGDAGHQRAVQIEEGAHVRSRRRCGDHGEGVGGGHATTR